MPNSDKDFRVYYQNVRGLRTQTKEIYSTTSDVEYDVLALTETWLDYSIKSSELFSSNVLVFRSDRNFECSGKSRGGGALLAIKSNLSCSLVDTKAISANMIDAVACKILLSTSTLHIFCIYIPPKTPVIDVELFLDMLCEFCSQLNQVLIVGDFNFPEFAKCLNKVNTIYTNFMNFLDLRQCNYILNSHKVMLDLVFTNVGKCAVFKEDEPILREDSHHPAFVINMILK